MANSMFDAGRESFLGGDSDWDANTVFLIIVDHTDDTPNVTTDDNLDDITAAARVAESTAFGSKTKTAGTADAADVTLSAVSGDGADSIVIFKETGTESTSTLWVFIDTATGLPVTPNGGDIIIQWNASGIFKL
jgi:hypothetical protein